MPNLPKIPRVQPFRTTAKGLVGCWPGFEGAGPTLHDISGYANDGVFGGGAGWADPPAGAVGMSYGAVSLDGSTGYVDCGNSAVLNPAVAFSITAWVYPAGRGTNDAQIVSRDTSGGGTRSYFLSIDAASPFNVLFATFAAGDVQTTLNGVNTVPLSQWTHVAATYAGGAGRIYLDGSPDNSGSAAASIQATATHTLIGARGYAGFQDFFPGLIGETRFYSRALAPSEIWDIYTGNG